MLADVFDSAEIVRVFDLLLDDPGREYTKTEIAEGASVSRPTLYKIWGRLERLGVLKPTRRLGRTGLYRLNRESVVVASLLAFDNELSKAMAKAGISTPEPQMVAVVSRNRKQK